MVILELIHSHKPDFTEGLRLLDTEPTQACLALSRLIVPSESRGLPGDVPFEFLTYQLDGRVLAYHCFDG